MKIRIVTDSTCDLPDEIINRYQIVVVPNILVINGRAYQDGSEISREEFYTQLASSEDLPTTAAASVGIYQEVYRQLVSQGAGLIFSIHAAASLTGIFNTARTAAEIFPNKVSVVDSKQLSMGLGFQVLAAARAIEAGASAEEILAQIESTRRRVKVFAMLDTLEFVKRSGRISWARFHLASLLQIRPIIELRDGAVYNKGEYRTRKKSLQQLSRILEQFGRLEYLVILHTNAEEEALAFQQKYQAYAQNQTWICNVTPVIGTHVGPNGLGFAAVLQKPAELN